MSSLNLRLNICMSERVESDGEGISNNAADFPTPDAEPKSPGMDSEYDEFLGLPESLTVIDIAGEPVLVEGKEEPDSGTYQKLVPFSTIHNSPVKFNSYHRRCFIPGIDINVNITDNERSVTTHLLNPNLYTIQLQHGDYTWVIKKRYKHIQHLHQQLRLFRTSLNIPFPTKTHKERRNSFKNNTEQRKGKKKGALPRFPSKPDALVPYENLPNRIKQLENYLNNLLTIDIYRNHHETLQFLEVSNLSFIQDLGIKGKEGFIQKRTGSTQPGQTGCNCFGFLQSTVCVRCNYFCNDLLCGKWRNRWFFVKETCFGYIRPKDGCIKCVILFDQGFEVSSGMYSTGMHRGLQIMTLSRQLIIRCWTRRKGREWIQYLKDVASHEARDFTQPNQHNSFVPVRTNIRATWFVDGAGYMSAVADALESATEEIFIADWWLSPEIYMKRPAINGEYWRLDKILERKAQQGVKVFVLLYKELEMALGINSFYSKQRLTECSENIKVLRHPDHAKVGVFLWAHHEKIVVVDQNYAFIGGIDLCYGRWDDAKHRLTDLGSLAQHQNSMTSGPSKKKTSSTPTDAIHFPPKQLPIHPASLPTFPEPDIVASSTPGPTPTPSPSTPLSQTTPHSVNFQPPTFERHTSLPPIYEPHTVNFDSTYSPPPTPPPLPQLQPGDSLLMPKPLVENMKCNTPEFERKAKVFDKLKLNVRSKSKDLMNLLYSPHEDNYEEVSDTEGADSPEGKCSKIPERDLQQLDGSAKLWIGKDYTNFIVKDFTNLEMPYVDLVDRNTTPRMPWHDIGAMVQGQAARDVARHFIQRWNATKLEKARLNPSYPYLLPKSYSTCSSVKDLGSNLKLHNVTCQVLRSASGWSCGFLESETVESSIHEAYVDSINRAQHFVYIENQFFVTLNTNSAYVRNQIGDALFKRIMRAHRENAVFRVYVVMPLIPGFEGEIGGATGTALHAVTHWNYASISNGKHAILNRLKEAGISDPSEYISFCGLRTHALLNNEPITELIYVHSKLMIVDDRTVICGSANINDRSMLGKRDSEIAVIIQDEAFDEGTMNGETFPSGKFAGSLRRHLFKEHLGILGKDDETEIDVTDPVTEKFYKDVWYFTAELNTEFYENVFHCIPSDKVQNFAALKKYQEEPPLYHSEVSRATKMLEDIQGHLVLLPLHFLCNENLTPSGNTVEGMMPTALWT